MKNLCLGICSSLLFLSSGCFGQQPYDSVHVQPYVPYFLPNAYQVGTALSSITGSTFLDVGSHDGAAARYIAQNSDSSVSVISVDMWSDNGSYQQFLSNVVNESSSNKIIPIRMSSDEAAVGTNIMADVIYIGTANAALLSHGITSWFSHLKVGGSICGDNFNHNDVAMAVLDAANQLDLTVSISGTFWTMKR
jgi:hypothetical protein